jgi:hypothetical protein
MDQPRGQQHARHVRGLVAGNPKTTGTDGGKELDSIVVAVGDDDPDPVSLPVGTITVDEPVVTNWHTDPVDAVPFN